MGKIQSDQDHFIIQYELFNILNKKRINSGQFTGSQHELRALAHKVSNDVYQELTGLKGIYNTKIAYVATDRKVNPSYYKLQMVDADGALERTILQSKLPILSPNWAQDGRQLAYVSFETGKPAIYIQDIHTGKRERVTSFKGLNGAPAWSPDGTKLALVLSKDGNPEVYVLNLLTKKLDRITKHYAIDTEPVWGIDGKSILFTSDRGGKPQIYRITLDTGWIERITFEGDYNSRAMLTSDGKYLVMVNRIDGIFHIATQDLQYGTINILTETDLDESPSIAPNGSMVVYATQQDGKDILSMVSIDGRIKVNLPSVQGLVRDPAWSPYLD